MKKYVNVPGTSLDFYLTLRSDSCVEEINNQWFACVDASCIDEPITYRLGEIVNAGVYGPFDSEDDAESWLLQYDHPNLALGSADK